MAEAMTFSFEYGNADNIKGWGVKTISIKTPSNGQIFIDVANEKLRDIVLFLESVGGIDMSSDGWKESLKKMK